MILFIKILLAHFIGDFLLQPDSWVAEKNIKKGKSPKLYFHILIHFLLMLLITWDLSLLPMIGIIAGLHLVIDLCKLLWQNEKNIRWAFGLDQIAHIVSILIVVNEYTPFISKIAKELPTGSTLAFALAILLLTSVSSRIIKIMISRWTPENEDRSEESLSNAGSYIGMLERLFIFTFVVMNSPSSVGFLLAAKSVFRFGDLKESKDRKLTEYILIGTLLSFGVAMLISLGYKAMLKYLAI